MEPSLADNLEAPLPQHQQAQYYDNNQDGTPSTQASRSTGPAHLEAGTCATETPMPPPPPKVNYSGLVLIFLAPALGGFLYGYDIGATSFVLSMLRNSRNHASWWHDMSKVHEGFVVSTLALGALLGSHIVLVYLAHSIGRRKEIRIAATLYIVGAACNVMSGTMLAESEKNYSLNFWNQSDNGNDHKFGIGLLTLLFGRILYGVGVGFIMHGAPTYMAEMSPSHVRGALVSAKETVIVFGIVVGMVMGDLVSDYPDNWTDLYGFSILFAVPMLLLTFKIPRSKRWLLMKGYRDEAKQSMGFVYEGNIEHEFDMLAASMDALCCNTKKQMSIDESETTSLGSMGSMGASDEGNGKRKGRRPRDDSSTVESRPSIWSKKHRHIMMIAVGLLVSQQFSGQPSVLAYSRVLFDAAGWQGHASVVTVLIMAFTSAGAVALVDRLGRKILLGLCCLIMIAALLALAAGFWGWEDEDDNLSVIRRRVILAAMFVYIAGYQVGFGPITWCVLSEIFPTDIRGSAMAFSVEVNFLSKFLCQLFFPIIQDLLGWTRTFGLFVCILVFSLFFIGTMVPETKGMSLEEIELQLKSMFGRTPNIVGNDSMSSETSSISSKRSMQLGLRLPVKKQSSDLLSNPLLTPPQKVEYQQQDEQLQEPRPLVKTLSEPSQSKTRTLPPVV